ncbi:MAG: hypothetical protein LBO09_09455 [Candidatus Peribacteria bacterium]|jgi:hypothetical protein|nr:hypothetical protein [Candidatus Peribacteria bacterium]
MLIERKTKDCEYIVGPAGVGKTTLALSDQYGAKIIETQQDIIDLLTLNFDELVCVTSILDETIAKNAKRITLLHANEERLRQHRALRDAQILEGTSQTAFGRNPGSTQGATIDDDILISRLKKDYEDKSRIISYTSDDVANFDEKKEISVKDGIGDEVKYLQQGITSSSGKFSPIHVVHEKLLRKGYEFAQEHALPFCILVVRNS